MDIRQERNDFIRLSAQLIAQSMVTALVGAADAIMTGALDQGALSAITFAGQVVQLFSCFIMSLCIGCTVLASQYYGVHDLESVRKVMNVTLKTGMSGAAVFFLATLLLPETLMDFFTDEAELIVLGIPYLRMISPSFLFMGFSQIYMNVMKNTDRARQSAAIGAVTAALNVLLNYLLIFGHCGLPRLGVTGAAVATTISRSVELVISLVFSTRGNVRFTLKGFFKSGKGIRRKFWRYTAPTMIQSCSWKLATTCTVAIVGHLGNDFVAASSFALIVYSVLGSIADGYGGACGIRIGRCLGSGETEKAKRTGDRLLAAGMVLALCVGGLTCLCCPLLVRANSAMTDAARGYLRAILFFTGFRCLGRFFNTTLSMGIFSAGGDVMYLLKLDVINMWLVTLPLGLLAAYVLHLPPLAVYMVLNLDEVYKIAVMAKRYRSRAWVRNLTKKEWAPPGRYENEMRGEILRRMPLGVMVISASGRVSLANPAAAELLGRDLADIEGSNYVELFMQDGENAEFADLAIEAVSDKLVTHEGIVSYRGEGGVTRIHVKSSFLEDEDCRLGVCLMLSRAE